MEYQDAFDFDAVAEQEENLERVSSRIAWAIIRFCSERLSSGQPTFHADELRAAVVRDTGIAAPQAPTASCGRSANAESSSTWL